MLQNLPEDEFELQQEMLNTALLSSAVGSIAQACRSKDANELKGHLDGLWDILYAFEDVEERDKVVAGVLDLYAKDSTMRGAAIIETFMLAATLNPYFLLVK